MLNEYEIELYSRDFWEFCKYYDTEFFTEEREHLKRVAEILENVRNGKFNKVAISMPPRAGKSYIVSLFCAFMLGHNVEGSIMRNSYSERLANKFSYDVRSIMRSDKFQAVFPVELADDKQAVTGWSLKQSKQVGYFCAGVGGSITGFGCNLLAILDDPIKNMEEALSEVVLESKWNWYTSTHKSRLEKGCPEIHIATRWSKRDIIGKLLEQKYFDNEITIPALDENGNSYCEDLKPLTELLEIKKLQAPFIWEAEYMQHPVEVEGLLFPIDELKRFSLNELKNKPDGIQSAVDTADKGTDYLCNPTGKLYGNNVYIVDVIYTQESIELTEPEVAQGILNHKVNRCRIESNAGGRSFAVNIQKLVGGKCYIEESPTTQNKETRILMKSGYIKTNFWFRNDYKDGSQYDIFMRHLTSYIKGGKNRNDDAPDGLTILAESLEDINSFFVY